MEETVAIGREESARTILKQYQRFSGLRRATSSIPLRLNGDAKNIRRTV